MTERQDPISLEFLEQSVVRMQDCSERIAKCLKMLDDEAFWYRPNEASNGIGQLLAHLSGNIRQYIHSGIGGAPDTRERQQEFQDPPQRDRTAVATEFFEVVDKAAQHIKGVSQIELLRSRTVQGFELTGLGIILHVVEHLSYHTGQIAYITKLLTDRDLGFYKGIDLNVKNS
ncbi:MAG: DinB family protein [Robiginitalea sp.]|jgi:uncharacterized damage-inducible protein DinB